MRRRWTVVGGALVVFLAACAQGCLRESASRPPGDAGPVDFDQLRARAEAGDATSQSQLGRVYALGHDVERDLTEAVGWYRRAAVQGHAEAENELGAMYTFGWGVARDDAEALSWFRRAAERGYAAAERNIGTMYLQGRGVAKDGARAAEWYRRAADRGLAAAQRDLGRRYVLGDGVTRDRAEGIKWLRRAVEQGDAEAQAALGWLYVDEGGASQAEGVRLLRSPAAQGNTDAQNTLGWAYLNGRGVSADSREAAIWWGLAARNGNLTAQGNMGLLYSTGDGVPKDLAQAARWYRLAASQGDATAEVGLGALYERGEGVPKDPVRAYLWYHLAAEQGNADAIKRRAALADAVDPSRLDAARQLAPRVKPGDAVLQDDTTPPRLVADSPRPAHGRPDDPLPRAALFVGASASHPRLSPDGRRLAYVARWNSVRNIWVRTVGERDDRPVTREAARDLTSFTWQCDGEHLLFTRDRDGDERPHLYQLDLRSGAIRDLTPPTVTWMGDPNQGECREPDLALATADASAYRVNLGSGTATLDTHNPGNVVRWGVDRALQVRAALAWTQGGESVLRVRDHRKAPWRTVQRWDYQEESRALFTFTADGRGLLLVVSAGASTARLLRIDLATGQTTVLAEDPHYDVDSVLVHPATREAQAVRFVRARPEWTILDSALRPDFEALRSFCDGDADVVSRDATDRTWVVLCGTDDHPPTYHLYVRATRASTALFAPDPALQERRFARLRPIEVRARDGLTLPGYLAVPPGPAPKDPKMVLLAHGGPWARDTWQWHPIVQWLTNRGYSVLQVNFRGSTGYGKAHLLAGDREWGAKMLDDLLDTRSWAIDHGYARAGKICIMGLSYGGYATLAALAFAPDAFACGVAIAGVSHIPSQIRAWATPWRWYWERHVGSLDTDEALLRSRSPLLSARSVKAPLLLVHGDGDRRVERLQSDLMASAMLEHKRQFLYLVLPDDGHGFLDPANRLRLAAGTEEFLASTLGGRFETLSPQEDLKPFVRAFMR